MNKIKKIIKLKNIPLLIVAVVLLGFLYVNTKNNFSNLVNDHETQETDVYDSNKEEVKNDRSSDNYQATNDFSSDEQKDKNIKLPSDTKSTAQNEIRDTTKKEYVYYPLLVANDPLYSTSWALEKTNTASAWDIATGNGQTVVAVIDTGFALEHEDLKDSWFINTGESGYTSSEDGCWTGVVQDKYNNNCDDDNNGYIDDWRGWNFYLGDNNPMAGRTNPNGDGVSHGTETAGLAGATGNNNRGIATINWNTKLMPLQVLSDDGPGYTSDVTAAIYYAVNNGADVINMSLGGVEYDETLELATDYAFDNDVIVIAAAGNCGTSCDGAPVGSMSYPALNKNVISIGATTSTDQRASFSSYGPELDIVAPGSGSITSTTWTPSNSTSAYATSLYGTSYAAPQVSSLASLIKSIRPNSSARDMTALLIANSDKLTAMDGALYNNYLGHGIINSYKSMVVAESLNSSEIVPELLQIGNSSTEHRYDVGGIITGCKNNVDSYCTITMQNEQNGYIRYLPYQKIGLHGVTNWTWNSSLIGTGSWQLRAIQGNYQSPSYQLSRK